METIGYPVYWLAGVVAITALVIGQSEGHGSHSHGHQAAPDGERPKGFHDTNVVHDQDHIMEHYEGRAKFNESDMTPEELEFHYFKLHDFDNNTMLDGLEILKALTHLLPYEDIEEAAKNSKINTKGKTADQIQQEKREEELKYYAGIVDSVLEEDDIDHDGYLTYLEYVLARKREEAREARERVEKRQDDHRQRRRDP